MGCFGSKPAKEESSHKVKDQKKNDNKQKENVKTPNVDQPKGTPPEKNQSNGNKEGTHVPKAKGDKPVIEDRPNGKKEVVSGDKSILLDEIYDKHYSKLDKKRADIDAAKQAWLDAKEKKDPNTQQLHQAFQDAKTEFENTKTRVTKDAYNEVQIYVVEDDVIDLHGLQLEGAVVMMKEQIEERRKAGKKILKIQCGMGKHNTVGFSKIKEEVVKNLKSMSEKYTEDKEHGFVNVEL
ncbi:Smr domain-containing protein [Entamoeba marina]